MNYPTEKQNKSGKSLLNRTSTWIIAGALSMEVATVYTLRQFSTPSVPEETLVIPEITTVTALG